MPSSGNVWTHTLLLHLLLLLVANSQPETRFLCIAFDAQTLKVDLDQEQGISRTVGKGKEETEEEEEDDDDDDASLRGTKEG